MLRQLLTSSLGRKLLMALTGLFLCTFLIVHLAGNFQLFKDDHGYAFNTYAVLMTTNPFIKTVSYVLYALILFHAFQGLYLAFNNRKARPVQYAHANTSSSLASRNMGILGTILLVYIVVHMGDFWAEYKFGHVPFSQYVIDLKTNKVVASGAMPADYTQEVKMMELTDPSNPLAKIVVVKDLYKEVQEAFKNIALVLFYVLGMVAMAFHLVHGFQSAFQSLGFNHPKYTPTIKTIGIIVFGVLIPLAFAAMPLFFYFKSM
jgi:succinate dehydrogenase / fumarate reductase, cytochrome b subunit